MKINRSWAPDHESLDSSPLATVRRTRTWCSRLVYKKIGSYIYLKKLGLRTIFVFIVIWRVFALTPSVPQNSKVIVLRHSGLRCASDSLRLSLSLFPPSSVVFSVQVTCLVSCTALSWAPRRPYTHAFEFPDSWFAFLLQFFWCWAALLRRGLSLDICS